MRLTKVKDFARYQEIVDKYKRKGCLSNDYIYQEAADLIFYDKLFEYTGVNNAFLFVVKDECLRVYYYLNDINEQQTFDTDEDLVLEILFRGNTGTPDKELDYFTKCGFRIHLRRDQYCGVYKDLQLPRLIAGVTVQKAATIEEVETACALFNETFDHFSGDFISNEVMMSLYAEGRIWIAKNMAGHFAGALHQTIDRNVAWISHVAVEERYRSQGVGQALLDTFVEQNKVDEKSRYMLWVQAQNAAAVNMYQKKGFKYMNKSTISMLKLK